MPIRSTRVLRRHKPARRTGAIGIGPGTAGLRPPRQGGLENMARWQVAAHLLDRDDRVADLDRAEFLPRDPGLVLRMVPGVHVVDQLLDEFDRCSGPPQSA